MKITIDQQRVDELDRQHTELLQRFKEGPHGRNESIRRDCNEVALSRRGAVLSGGFRQASIADSGGANTLDLWNAAFAAVIVATLGGVSWLFG